MSLTSPSTDALAIGPAGDARWAGSDRVGGGPARNSEPQKRTNPRGAPLDARGRSRPAGLENDGHGAGHVVIGNRPRPGRRVTATAAARCLPQRLPSPLSGGSGWQPLSADISEFREHRISRDMPRRGRLS